MTVKTLEKDELAKLLSERPSAEGKLFKGGLGVLRAANLPGEDELKALAESAGVEWREGYAARVVPYIASTELVDSYGDIVRQEWIFDRFEKNPVMPLSHGWGGLPIANAIKWWIGDVDVEGYKGPALQVLALFHAAEVNEQSESVLRMIRAGLLRGVSPGFWPGEVISPQDAKERADLGLGAWGAILTKNHLAEVSPCAIPANPAALVDLVSAKRAVGLTAADIAVLRECLRSGFMLQKKHDDWERVDEQVVRSARILYPGARFERRQNIDRPFDVAEDPAQVRVAVHATKADAPDPVVELGTKIDALTGLLQEGLLGLQAAVEDLSDKLDLTLESMGGDEGDDSADSKRARACVRDAKVDADKTKDSIGRVMRALDSRSKQTED